MNRRNDVLTKNRNGEFVYEGLNDHVKKQYRADTPLDNPVVPYIIMLFCATVDAACFISLFKMISYDSMFMLGIQVAGFLFAFDVVPIYLGIQHRRIKQNLTKDRIVLYLALGVCATAFIINIILNVMTIELMNPDLSSAATNYFGTATEQVASESIDPSTIALAIFRIGCTVLTSVGSYFISYSTYDPIKTRKRTIDETIVEKKDEIRRMEALIDEYKADPDFAENLRDDDERKYEEMKNMHRALVINYCIYVRQRLKEHLANPTSTNALSEEDCIAILQRLDRELETLNQSESSRGSNDDSTNEERFIKNYIAV